VNSFLHLKSFKRIFLILFGRIGIKFISQFSSFYMFNFEREFTPYKIPYFLFLYPITFKTMDEENNLWVVRN